MPARPGTILRLLGAFAPVFSRRVWRCAQVLVAGALLTPGKRTVAAALRVAGLARARRFERYHRVLNRARWSGLAVSRILLGLLVAAFVPDGPLVVGVDETIERRRGARIAAKGIYRDAVRSSRSHFVKASGLRWVSVMLLAPIPWAGRVWALPFLTALAPSERHDAERGRRHKTLPDWARQLLLNVWYHGGMPTVPLRWVLIRDPRGAFAPQALLGADQEATPGQVLAWFVLRWQLEVTWEEARRHLGVETQRQWSDLAIRRVTPALFGLFSLVALHAHQQAEQAPPPVRRAAWYPKTKPTFADALALVRRELWAAEGFALSARDPDVIKLPRKFVDHLTETLAYAA